MIVELSLLIGGNYLTYKYLNRQYEKFKKNFDDLILRIPSLRNNQDETVRLLNYCNTDYGFELKILLPVGISSEQFEKQLLPIKQGLGFPTINLICSNRLITLQGIKNYKYREYEPLNLKPNEILVGEFMGESIIVDMNSYPHALICGDTGTGKSFLLFTILTNLVQSYKVNIYLLQVRKNDLVVFRNCKQVKSCSKTLEEVLVALQDVDKELQRREQLLDVERGFLNIETYNKTSGNTLRYIYVCIEEFSFLNISRVDSKDEKRIKYECMKHIKSIVNAGRSSGVFLLTSLQKPTNDSIPTDIKAQLTTRIALNIKDASTCRVVMDNDSAVDLEERQLICRTKGTELGYSLTIDFHKIKKYTKDSIIKKSDKIIRPKAKEENTSTDIMRALGL